MANSESQRKRAEVESTEGASTSSFISSAATGVGSGQYDVFLSFSGSDTRKEFTDHLYQSLVKVGTVPTYMFKDDKSIPIGEEFSSQIFDAIAQSKISIPIISENYASSKWCLRELIYIMERKKSSSHIVLPIFYKVSPANVGHLTGNFGDAFRLRVSRGRFDEKIIHEGSEALREVSDLHGWESTKVANGHEGELIQLVVKTVLSKLQKDFQLVIPGKLIGLDDRLMEIVNFIPSPSKHARMIGIYGMGGIGKTTLAKCIYNQLLDEFEHASFLPNIREKATHYDGMKDLQSQLISNILRSQNKLYSIDEGINVIKSRFKRKKVLILLDDIDDQYQLDKLVGERDWFMEGSMIIVTTRNEAVLVQSKFGVDYKYEMEGLDKIQSLILFNRHAFRIDHSPQDFESISRDIVSTMGGLPLALEVVGSYLYKKTNQKVWEDVRKQLQSQPHRDVEKILRISYDALEDGHKQIFVDIACFFIGESLDILGKYMMCMWEDRGFYPSQGIEELKLRCLIKIGDDSKLDMHDQLRDLGRSIFCQGQPLEKRIGPWNPNYKGVLSIIRYDMLSWYSQSGVPDLMRAALSGDKDLSEVRWLQWKINESDSSLSTANLRLPKLAVLDLTESEITKDWEGWSSLRASTRLRALNLTCSCHSRSAPDLSAFTQLKILNLSYCSQLEHLHPSIGKLKSLVSLDLSYCTSLKELPEEVGELKNLEELHLYWTGITQIPTSICSLGKLKTLDLSYCKSLKELLEKVGELKDLEELHLRGTGITQIPTSICSLGKLKKLDASCCESLRGIPCSIGDLQNLQHLDILCSGIEELPSAIGRLKNLRTLDISGILISDLPESIRNLSSLQSLRLDCCDKLRSVPELPSSLTHVWVYGKSLRLPQLCSLIHLERLHLKRCHLPEDISDIPSRLWKLDGFRYLAAFSVTECSSIEILDLSELVHLKRLGAWHCNNLVEIQGLDKLELLEYIIIQNCDSIINLLYLKSQFLKELNVRWCNNLVEIQGHLYNAERLIINGCKSLKTLPDLTGCEKLRSLTVVDCKKLTQIWGLERLDSKICYISVCGSLEAFRKLSRKQFLQKL